MYLDLVSTQYDAILALFAALYMYFLKQPRNATAEYQ